jgi:hypothetical protein
MNTIQITGVTGNPPYSISVCDYTYSYCYLVTGSTTIPPTFTFDVPSPLENSSSLIIKIVDSNNCEYLEYYTCPPTPTPTLTITPTPSPTPTDLCFCITAVNSTSSDGFFDYIDCLGHPNTSVLVPSGVTYYVCGSSPSNPINLTLSLGSYCFGGTCPTPSSTPTTTPTVTPTVSLTPSLTPTNTPTISITPTISVTPSVTASLTPTPTYTPTLTPTMTPSSTPTSMVAYLFIEPKSGDTVIGNYMFTNGSPQFFGFNNATQPSSNPSDFNFEMNLYVDYSGWTSGSFPSIITSYVPQTTGGNDSFGNPIVAYNFETVQVSAGTVSTDAWYTWIIPIGLTNLQYQTQIDFSTSNPNILTNVLTEATIYTNTFTYTGTTIPPITYRVYTTYPSVDFYLNNTLDDIYFRGNTVSP